MSRSPSEMEALQQQRFSEPWSPNPWFNPRAIGPRQYRGTYSKQQYEGLAVSLPPPVYAAAALVAPSETRELRKKDWRQLRAALSIWDDEGGR
jgi:hypothetical protein